MGSKNVKGGKEGSPHTNRGKIKGVLVHPNGLVFLFNSIERSSEVSFSFIQTLTTKRTEDSKATTKTSTQPQRTKHVQHDFHI